MSDNEIEAVDAVGSEEREEELAGEDSPIELLPARVEKMSFGELAANPGWVDDIEKGHTLKLSINSRRNKIGEWVDSFTARTETRSSSDRVDLDLTHSIYEANGKRQIFIQGISNSPSYEIPTDQLTFHPRCGKNIAITNKGRTVQKISNDDSINSVVFTNRALKDNEVFEVRLDKKNTKFGHCLGIGIITGTASDVIILPEMYKSAAAKIYLHNYVYSNSATIHTYPTDICKLVVGDRVGVMRSEFGALHFFINGVDQGPAASNVPSPVYGLFELWYDATQATIVDASSPQSS